MIGILAQWLFPLCLSSIKLEISKYNQFWNFVQPFELNIICLVWQRDGFSRATMIIDNDFLQRPELQNVSILSYSTVMRHSTLNANKDCNYFELCLNFDMLYLQVKYFSKNILQNTELIVQKCMSALSSLVNGLQLSMTWLQQVELCRQE